jgi:hypothetical protein
MYQLFLRELKKTIAKRINVINGINVFFIFHIISHHFNFLLWQHWFYFIIAYQNCKKWEHFNQRLWHNKILIFFWKISSFILFYSAILNFHEKRFRIIVLSLPKTKKNWQKYHFWKYWVKNINIFDAILNTAAILNFHDWQQMFYNRTVFEI